MKWRNQSLRGEAFERDNFTCQKCKVKDDTGKKLEVHHISPLCFGGKDELGNLITLCFDCHHLAPNKKEDFEKYLEEEMEGTLTNLMRAWEKSIKEHPELLKELNK